MTSLCDPIPVLLYHSVGDSPSAWIAPFTVSARAFQRHLLLLAESGRTPVTLSNLRDGLDGLGSPPANPVVVTFDDGFADTHEVAALLLDDHHVPATIYLTTGFMGRRSPGGDRMLGWGQAAELARAGHEIGAHTTTHPQLDTLATEAARREVRDSRHVIEDRLGVPVRSFAYPHGYSSPAVRRLVVEAGYDSACSVKNACSSRSDSPFSIARLTVTRRTTDEQVRSWLAGNGNRVPPRDERLATRGWRAYRRALAAVSQSRGPE